MTHPIRLFLPTEPEGIEYLLELALDLRWSWDHGEDQLWAQLDPELWALTHNPWVVLQTVSRTKLQALAADPRHRRLATAEGAAPSTGGLPSQRGTCRFRSPGTGPKLHGGQRPTL
jgi:hypothetical protein